MEINKIAIIGAGNLGLSIVEGLIKSGMVTKENLILAEKFEKRAEELKSDGYDVTHDSKEATQAAQIVMMIVKPWQAEDLLNEIAPFIDESKILASCITGLNSETIYSKLTCKPPLFRIMPNTGMSLGESMSCIAPFNANDEQIAYFDKMFNYLGKVIFIAENQMAAGTAMAGSGIAFALRFIRAATEAGVQAGFSAADAKLLAAQITKGAAELILNNDSHPEAEIDKVTTPKGTTINGLNEMEHNGFTSAVVKGILKAYSIIDGDK